MEFELLLAIALVVMVIFLFLRSLAGDHHSEHRRAAVADRHLRASCTWLGFSLNNLAMMALTISTGFVVDDAIVMIENISRYIEAGEQPLQAALKGAAADRLHHPVADRLADRGADPAAVHGRHRRAGCSASSPSRSRSTIVLSAFISLTLTPMMSARLLRHTPPEQQGRFYRASGRVLERVIDFYGATLKVVLRYQRLTLLVAAATLVLTGILYAMIPRVSSRPRTPASSRASRRRPARPRSRR